MKLFSDLNRSTTASDGYERYQISRNTISGLLEMVKKEPEKAVKLLELCLHVRGKDKRNK